MPLIVSAIDKTYWEKNWWTLREANINSQNWNVKNKMNEIDLTEYQELRDNNNRWNI